MPWTWTVGSLWRWSVHGVSFACIVRVSTWVGVSVQTRVIFTISIYIIKGKGSFYIAQYPVRWTAQSALHFSSPGRPVHSDTNSASPGSILARQQLRAKTKKLTFPPLPMTRYSFIQLSEQGHQWRERKGPIFETVAKGDSNPGSLDCETGILPLSYRTAQKRWKQVLNLQAMQHTTSHMLSESTQEARHKIQERVGVWEYFREHYRAFRARNSW